MYRGESGGEKQNRHGGDGAHYRAIAGCGQGNHFRVFGDSFDRGVVSLASFGNLHVEHVVFLGDAAVYLKVEAS